MGIQIPFNRMLLALAISIAGPGMAQTSQQQQNNSSGQTARVMDRNPLHLWAGAVMEPPYLLDTGSSILAKVWIIGNGN